MHSRPDDQCTKRSKWVERIMYSLKYVAVKGGVSSRTYYKSQSLINRRLPQWLLRLAESADRAAGRSTTQ